MGQNKKHSARAKKNERPRDEPAESAPGASAPEVAAPAVPARLFNPAIAAEAGALLLLPLAAFWVMRFVPINQNHFLDPYVYTGYIHNFDDLMARYGLTYYSVRFGLIVPAQWFARLFGVEDGYLAFRYVLALVASIPLYCVVKRHFSQPIAILTVAGMLTSPYFARALLWDYPDSAGVSFLTAAVCLFLLEERPSLWRDTLAGACAAMAVHSNFFVVALVGIFSLVWSFLALWFRHPLKDVARHFSGVALGAFLVTLLGCLYYWRAIGRPADIFSVTFGMASSLANGGTRQWRVPGISWIATQIHVLLPVLLGVCCILVTRWRRITFTGLVIVTFGVAATAFYYIEQLFLGSDVLQLFYYFSYLIPAVFLMLAYLWQALWEQTRRGAPAFVAMGLTALLGQWMLAIWGDRTLPNLTILHWLALCGVAVAALFLATRDWRWPSARSLLSWVALILLGGCFTAAFSDYSNLMRNRHTTDNQEMDVYRVAQQFMHAVPKVSEHPGIIRFWYNNRIGNSINSVQSTFLWGYSKINTNPPEDPGLPHLGEFQLHLLRDPQLRYLGLLGETDEELSLGLAALTREGIEFTNADYRELASGDYRIYYQLVELTHRSDAIVR